MNNIFRLSGMLALAFVVQVSAQSGKPWQIQNRLRLEYDDNIRQEATDTDDSLKVIEELTFNFNLNLQNTFIGFSYTPAVTWWSDRDEDDLDVQHYLKASVSHAFTPRVSLKLNETFLRAEKPELIERGSSLREENDYNQNNFNGDLDIVVAPDTRVSVGGRYLLLRYDDDAVAALRDYDLIVGGLTLARQFGTETEGRIELRAEQIAYDEAVERDSDTYTAGLAVDQTFSPSLVGSIRVGGTMKEYDAAEVEDTTSPYADVSLTLLPSPATRITGGAGYSLFEAGVFPYVNQDRLRAFASLAHDITARISFYLTGSYTLGQYDAEEVVEGSEGEDGDEEILQLSARAAYQVNRSNWLEASYQYTDFTSDLSGRVDYDRSRVSLGWRTSL